MELRQAVKREMRVAFSPTAQPPWVRVLKWIVVVSISLMLWRTAWFWWWILGSPTVGLIVHFFWRWKTHGWTQPWIGWDDVKAINGSEPFSDRRPPEQR